MRRLILALVLLTLSVGMWAQNGKVGTSVGIVGGVTPWGLAQIKEAGIGYIEVTMNPFWRKLPQNEVYIKAYKALNDIKESGLKVWSVHLPYGWYSDISVTDDAKRERAVGFIEEMIRLAAIFEPERLVLHPSSDNVKDEEREERLKCARNSIGRLALAAQDIDAVLCIEDLPRTCLGRTADEMLYLTDGIPNVMVCFDTNHLLRGTHDEFFEKLGDRIGTIHVSDYDKEDEKHWLPFHEHGVVDWGAFYRNLKKCGYKGVFMFEVRGGNAVPADLVNVHCRMKKL